MLLERAAVGGPTWSTPAAHGVFIAFSAVAIWSSVPLTLRVFTTLKRRRGPYFWSLLITSWGLCIRQIGYTLSFLAPWVSWIASNILAQAGWVAMVTGFSVVLYSRLNLIVESRKVRRWALVMIVADGLIFHPAMITLSIGQIALRHEGKLHAVAQWQSVFKPLERIQILVFSAQETIISFFYVWAAYQYLRSRFEQGGKTRSAMILLLVVQLVIVAVDIALIAIDFAGLLELKLFIHSFVYAAKLELEFVVLNQLVELSKLGVPGLPSSTKGLTHGSQKVDDEAKVGDSPGPEFMTAKAMEWTPPQSPDSQSISGTRFAGPSQKEKRDTMFKNASPIGPTAEMHEIDIDVLGLKKTITNPDG
ncbi:hypothetical protein NA57DRAFT_74907 [Rhizodiscina lignyota]|uniref:DUF7703 domain-containing protein n=1 Tax=Rhizodiscina lignyota TaxID=1504668 RepID=A0A9P4IJ27_9PEZI|nr:hypothetical protein NA57DRAFT_74907 [Rhizodiscina lignyota]